MGKAYQLMCAVYLGINAFIYFCLNQIVTGGLSDVYLAASVVCGLLAAVSAIYMLMEEDGEDATDADVTIPLINLKVSKMFWYLGMFAAIGTRTYFAYQSNHNATGAESLWGFVWIIASAILFLATFPNAKVYFQTKSRIAKEKARANAARTSATDAGAGTK